MWSTHRIQTLVNVAMIILLLFGPGTFAPVKAQEPAPAATGDPQPELLKDIYTANGSSNPGQFLANGNRVFYVASDPDHGEELWVSDGTAGGTQMVMDIYPGESDSNVSNLTLFRGQVYFSASPSMNNGEVRIYYRG